MSKKCLYCGNNPVPHAFTWYFDTSDVLLAPVRQRLLYNRFSRSLHRWLSRHNVSWYLTSLMLKLGLLSRQDDVSKCKTRRAQVLWEEAIRRGINFYEVRLFGKSIDLYMAQKEGIKLCISGLPRPENYDDSILDVMDDKLFLKEKLRAAGLPAPRGGSVRTWRQAKTIFAGVSAPVIVKPRVGSRGRHVTTFIYDEGHLKKAVKLAKQLCYWVIVEEQLFGPVYRATVINGKLCGVLRGDPPEVLGDGSHTLKELIEIKNAGPHPGVKDIPFGIATEVFLSRQGLTLASVPENGRIVYLSEKIGVNYGGSSAEELDICHEDNKRLFLRAAEVVGDPIVGFDFIIPNISRSYKDQRCGFIEANSLPFINLHHDPLHGTPQNVAAAVWDMMGL